jgi:hypothetical protein
MEALNAKFIESGFKGPDVAAMNPKDILDAVILKDSAN